MAPQEIVSLLAVYIKAPSEEPPPSKADNVFAVFATSTEPLATAERPVPPSATARSVIPVIDPPVIATLESSRCATRVPVVILRFPVVAPVKLPVPNVNLSALSSYPINALSALPRYITIPESFAGVPDVPVPSSSKVSATVVLVVAIVVVVPLTVRSPAIVTLFASAIVTLTSVPTLVTVAVS